MANVDPWIDRAALSEIRGPSSFAHAPELSFSGTSKKFLEGVEVRQRVSMRHEQSSPTLARNRAWSTSSDLLAAWPTLTIQERRRLMHGLLEQVVVTRATGRGRKAEPIVERTAIVLRGGAEL